MKKCPTCGTTYSGELCPKCVANFAAPTGGTPTAPTQPPEEAPLQPGTTFHGLEIVDILGKGGMGVVYKARQPALDRMVALKLLPKRMALDPDFQERFKREAKALASLSHPNIVAVYDFGAEDGVFFFAMEFIDGVSLRQVIRERKLSSEQAIKIVPQLCDALQYAHSEGVVHRDIKPENILIDRKGRVKIADFGLAKLTGADQPVQLTQTNMVMGTPHYMAPEQLENPKSVDHRADIYSMGVVFYEMLTNELPIGRFEVPSKKVQVDVRLDEVVLKTLEKEPDRRYQHASELKDDVSKCAPTGVDSYAPTMMTRNDKPAPRAPVVPIAIAAVLLVAAAIAFVFWPRPETKPQPDPVVKKDDTPKEPALNVEQVYLSSGDEEIGRRELHPDPVKDPFAPRNPYPAKAPEELDHFVKSLNYFGIPNVTRPDVKQGYLYVWYGVSMFAMLSPAAERIERDVLATPRSGHTWTYRRGEFLVIARAARDTRDVFCTLVARLQKKLGLPPTPPALVIRLARVEKSDLPSGWLVSEEAPGGDVRVPVDGDGAKEKELVLGRFKKIADVRPQDVRAVHWTAAEKKGGQPSVAYIAIEFSVATAADALETKLRGAPSWDNARKFEVLRAGTTVGVLALYANEHYGYEKIAREVRPWFGLPEYTFETIQPRDHELPLGAKFKHVEKDVRTVLDKLDVPSLRSADVANAFYATLDRGGAIALLELKDRNVAYEIRNELRSLGESWEQGGFICVVTGPDAETLHALEDRMREKYGWEPKTR
jgi:tRNA A-37 threonylcarbamoyl transferase component Bud32